MGKRQLVIGLGLMGVAAGFISLLALIIHGHPVAVLSPGGTVAAQQRNLLIFAALLSLVVIIPVFVLTFFIAWNYRAGNSRARYRPDWDHNTRLESLWWGIPCVIILVLAVVTWQSSHSLDPFKPLASTYQPMTIEVVALPWKWLFIYPEQNIATLNYVQFPEKTAVTFHLTADAPMNSFWIPRLGGQIYAMAGMTTQLQVRADQPGIYRGSSANLSGEGFAGMQFTARATSQADFYTWVQAVKQSPQHLTMAKYHLLAMPSKDQPAKQYASRDPTLYTSIINSYMTPADADDMVGHTMSGMGGTH